MYAEEIRHWTCHVGRLSRAVCARASWTVVTNHGGSGLCRSVTVAIGPRPMGMTFGSQRGETTDAIEGILWRKNASGYVMLGEGAGEWAVSEPWRNVYRTEDSRRSGEDSRSADQTVACRCESASRGRLFVPVAAA